MKETTLKDLVRECSAFITEKTQDIYDLVAGYGDPDSKIMFLTSYPTAKEETTGIYFEGKAGTSFDTFLSFLNHRRESVYTTYCIKYRPYRISDKSGRIINRDVTSEEVRMFYDFLVNEIKVISPRIIVTLGDLAYSALHKMEQDQGAVYGSVLPVRLGDTIYNMMALPHPSQGSFDKVAMQDSVKQALSFLEDRREETLASESDNDIQETSFMEKDIGQEDVVSSFYAFEEVDPYVEDVPEPSGFKELGSLYEPISKKPTYNGQIIETRGKAPLPKRKKRKISGKHKVVLVYGGSQLINDPSLVVAERISNVLTELNVAIKRIDLYKNAYSMDAFFEALEESDGVILATTVEWYGIGGRLQTFLDKAYASGQFDLFEGTYLMSVVISRRSFERDALNHMIKSWEILGGIEGVNLCASIESSADIETNQELLLGIDKRAEDFYRVMNQQRTALPTSIHDHKIFIKVPDRSKVDEGEQMVMNQVISPDSKDNTLDNQMSFIANYDEFIEKQQKDIEDIASLFRSKLTTKEDVTGKSIPELFEYKYKPDRTFKDCQISWVINDKTNQSFVMDFKGVTLKARYGRKNDSDVIISSDESVLSKITEGKLTIQRAFMTGEIKAKGNFTLLYKLDQLFAF